MDWNSQAIAGCTSEENHFTTIMNNNNNLRLSFYSELLFSFHEFSETTTVVDELEELYKSLYNNTVEINSDLSIPTSSLPVLKGTEEVKVLKPSEPDKLAAQDFLNPAPSKTKRRSVMIYSYLLFIQIKMKFNRYINLLYMNYQQD